MKEGTARVPSFSAMTMRGAEGRQVAVFRWLLMRLKCWDRLPPRVVAAAMMPTAISAAIRPYSMAVAPDSSATKLEKVFMEMPSMMTLFPSEQVPMGSGEHRPAVFPIDHQSCAHLLQF